MKEILYVMEKQRNILNLKLVQATNKECTIEESVAEVDKE